MLMEIVSVPSDAHPIVFPANVKLVEFDDTQSAKAAVAKWAKENKRLVIDAKEVNNL